jgi:hypothetical protein
MWVQLFIFIIAFIGLNLYPERGDEYQQQQARKKYIILIMALLALQSGLRHLAVGTDTFAYYREFNSIKNSSFNEMLTSFVTFVKTDTGGKDPGYRIFQYLFATIIPSFRIYLIAIAVFVFTALGRLLYRYTDSNKEVLVAVALYQCLFYSFFSITGLRQTIATGFLLFAVPYVFDKRWTKALILIALAATQHKSALLFVPFCALPYVKKTGTLLVISFITFIPMWKMGGAIAKFFMAGTRFEQYMAYLNAYEGAGAYNFTAFIIFFCVCLLFKYRRVNECGEYSYVFVNATAVALALTPLTMIDPSNMRIVQYYSIFSLISLPQFLTVFRRDNLATDVHMLVFLILGTFTLISNHADYGFFWQEMRLNENYGTTTVFKEELF